MLTPAPGTTRADAIALAARSMDASVPLEFIGHRGADDMFRRDRTIFVVPGMWESMPADLLRAARARRVASVTGECPVCAACVELASGTFRHGRRCPAMDERLGPMFARWARRVGPARGRRIVEVPGSLA